MRLWWPWAIVAGGVTFVATIAAIVVLTPTREERRTAFMNRCAAARFSAEQCSFLYALDQRRADDEFLDQMTIIPRRDNCLVHQILVS